MIFKQFLTSSISETIFICSNDDPRLFFYGHHIVQGSPVSNSGGMVHL